MHRLTTISGEVGNLRQPQLQLLAKAFLVPSVIFLELGKAPEQRLGAENQLHKTVEGVAIQFNCARDSV